MKKRSLIVIGLIFFVTFFVLVVIAFNNNSKYVYSEEDDVYDEDKYYLNLNVGESTNLIDYLELDKNSEFNLVSNSNDMVVAINNDFNVSALIDGSSEVIISSDGVMYEVMVIVNSNIDMATISSKFSDFTMNSCNDVTSKVSYVLKSGGSSVVSKNAKFSHCVSFPLRYVNDSGKVKEWWVQDFAVTDKYVYFSGPNVGTVKIGAIPGVNYNTLGKALNGQLSVNERKKFFNSYFNAMINDYDAKKISLTRVIRVPRERNVQTFYSSYNKIMNPSNIKSMYLQYGGHGHIDALTKSDGVDVLYLNGAAALGRLVKKNSVTGSITYKYRASHTAITYTTFKEAEGLRVPNNYIAVYKGGNKLTKISRYSGESRSDYYSRLLNLGLSKTTYETSPDMAVNYKTNKIALVVKAKAYLYNLSDFKKGKTSYVNTFDIDWKADGQVKANVAMDDEYLYVLYQHAVNKYRLSDGKLVSQAVFDFSKLLKVSNPNCGFEIEAISVHGGKVYIVANHNPKNGNPRSEEIFSISNF